MRALGRDEPLPIALYRSMKKAQAAPARNGTTTTTHNRRSTNTVYRRSGGGVLAIVRVRSCKDRSCSSNSRPSNRWSKPDEVILLAPKCLPCRSGVLILTATFRTGEHRFYEPLLVASRPGNLCQMWRAEKGSPEKYLNSRRRALRSSASFARKECRVVMSGLLSPARVTKSSWLEHVLQS